MESKAKCPLLLSICGVFLLIVFNPTLAAPQKSNDLATFHKSLESFGTQLFSTLANTNSDKNIIFSPFSIQTCIAMARMGAEGQTAQEMDQVMGLAAAVNIDELAENYHSILATYEKSNILKIANKIYVMQKYDIKEKFNELLTKQFLSSAERINFAASSQAAKTINSWVEAKTNNKIKDLLPASALNSATSLVLVNAIHFKGDWVHAFPERGTKESDFYLDETNTVKVQMMHISESFRYGEFPELDATALEMPYQDSDLSMLIILPNSRTGLHNLEEKLKTVSIKDLTQKMYSTEVMVDMPKFKAEFKVELSDLLQKMGMARMFSNNAEFGQMLKFNQPLQVSSVVHKAFIEVNEKGTEAAAATGITTLVVSVLPSIEKLPKIFIVDKPFYYAIQNKDGIALFKGNIKNF